MSSLQIRFAFSSSRNALRVVRSCCRTRQTTPAGARSLAQPRWASAQRASRMSGARARYILRVSPLMLGIGKKTFQYTHKGKERGVDRGLCALLDRGLCALLETLRAGGALVFLVWSFVRGDWKRLGAFACAMGPGCRGVMCEAVAV
eukprot:947157-Pleurochrysis_carterae.AAC.1